MNTNQIKVLSALCAAIIVAPGAAHGQTPVRFSVMAGFSLPAGDLGNSSDLGVNLAVRGEGLPISPGWTVRGDMAYDRYDGRGSVNAYSYISLAGNLVHHERSGRVYEFVGLGFYNSRIGFSNAQSRSDVNLGVQMGAGFDLTRDQRVFAEFGLTSAFTSGRSSVWFPIRIGLRF